MRVLAFPTHVSQSIPLFVHLSTPVALCTQKKSSSVHLTNVSMLHVCQSHGHTRLLFVHLSTPMVLRTQKKVVTSAPHQCEHAARHRHDRASVNNTPPTTQKHDTHTQSIILFNMEQHEE